jgi:hypothetical protein
MTTAFQGHRVSRAGCGGALNGFKAKSAQQDWSDGQTVKVGFLTLEVVAKVNGDYRLWNPNGGKKYLFTPHMGLSAGWEA